MNTVRVEVVPNPVSNSDQINVGYVNDGSQVVHFAECPEAREPTIVELQRSPTIGPVAELGWKAGVLNPERTRQIGIDYPIADFVRFGDHRGARAARYRDRYVRNPNFVVHRI